MVLGLITDKHLPQRPFTDEDDDIDDDILHCCGGSELMIELGLHDV